MYHTSQHTRGKNGIICTLKNTGHLKSPNKYFFSILYFMCFLTTKVHKAKKAKMLVSCYFKVQLFPMLNFPLKTGLDC